MEGKLKLFKILIFFSIFLLNVYPQTKNKLPKFDVNIGIGKVGGLRMGGRILLSVLLVPLQMQQQKN